MRHNRKHNLFGWLAASALLLTTACANDAMLDLSQGSGTRTVALTVLPQTQTNTTRGIETGNSTISTGQYIDVLIYAVYEKIDEGKYELVNRAFKNSQVDGITADDLGDGQTAVSAKGISYTNSVTVQVTVDAEKEYKVVFWAQNRQTDAYDTKDLEKVKVSYMTKNEEGNDVSVLVPARNNDEQRDAFCAVAEIIQGTPANKGKVYLRRPLAQVNVGTAGWDYEGAAYLKPSSVSYTKSTITLKGVAQYYNVLDGKTLSQDELAEGEKATTDATFSYYRLPAFINVADTEWDNPQITPYTGKDSEGNDDGKGVEEYLRVDIHNDGKFDPGYVGWKEFDSYRKAADTKAAYEKGKLPDTEEFKYLSMCYVLVPEATNIIGEVNPNAKYGSVLDKVSFTAQGTVVDKNEPLEKKVEVSNVPVQKNWRTNILGYNFFLGKQKYIIDIVPDYCGDYNDDEVVKGEWPKKTKTVKVKEVAATYTITFGNNKAETQSKPRFFTTSVSNTGTVNYSGSNPKYNNSKDYKYGLKMTSGGYIDFKTTKETTIVVVQVERPDANGSYSPPGPLHIIKDKTQGWTWGERDMEWEAEPDLKDPSVDFSYSDVSFTEYPLLKPLDDAKNQNVYVYKLENVPAGSYSIRRYGFLDDKDGHKKSNESGVVYVEVQELKEVEREVPDIDDDTIDDHKKPRDDGDGTFDDNYPSYRDTDGDDRSANKSTGGDNTPTEGE
ncbi:MAG: hypothetical protein J1E77_03340 [Prevotella sp.]|nr:hypothetical protein [Prevotella sp.]